MKLENSFTIEAPVEKAWEALNSPETVAPCFPGATLTNYEGDSFSGTVKVKLGPIAMTYKGKGTYVTRDEDAHEVVIDANGRDSRGNGTATAKVTASLAADGPDRTAVSMVTDMTITGKPAQFGRGVISDVADKIIGQFSACVARKLAPAAEEAEPAALASTNGVVPGTSETEAPASGILDAVTPAAVPADTGTSEAEAPVSADLAAGRAPTPTSPALVVGTSEAEAPASTDMRPDPRTTSPIVSPATTTTRTSALQNGPVRSEVEAIDLLDTAGAPVLKRLAPIGAGALVLVLVILLVRRLQAR